MGCGRAYLALFVILTISIQFHQCGRFGGNSDIQSTVGPDDVNRPPLQALAYRTTRRSHVTSRTTPRPTTRRTTHRTTPRSATPRTTSRPRTTRGSTTKPIITTPISTRRTTFRTTPRPITTRSTSKPIVTTSGPSRRPTFRATPRPITTRKSTPTSIITTRKTTPRPTTRTTTPKPTTPTRRTTYRSRKPAMNYPPISKSTTHKPRYTTTTHRPVTKKITLNEIPPIPGSGKKTKIVIKNTYNYHYPGFYTIPTAHEQYPGYYKTYTYYDYKPAETGSGILGFYLGYQLGKLRTPTYSHFSFYDGYRPRYDHYTVHHYYHNSNSIPKEQTFVSQSIVECVGDSSSICPANTTSLCTNDGRLMCLVSKTSLIDCTDPNNKQVKCTRSTISCTNNTALECKGTNKKHVTVDIPCVSTAKIQGGIKFVNKTIVSENGSSQSKYTNFNKQTANCTMSCINSTSLICSNQTGFVKIPCTVHFNSTNSQINCTTTLSCVNSTISECANKSSIVVNLPCLNVTLNGTLFHIIQNGTTRNETFNIVTNSTMKYVNNSLDGQMKYVNNSLTIGNSNTSRSDLEVITTTLHPDTTTVHWIWKRKRSPAEQMQQEFCVTIIAVPAGRVPTQGEEFLKDATSVLNNFIESVWNL